MKKAIGLLLALVLVFSQAATVFAAETWGGFTVEASTAKAQLGDTVTFTVYLDDCSALEGGVYNVGFTLSIPAGLEYVAGSGKIDAAAFEEATGMSMLGYNENYLLVGAMGALAQGYTGGKVAVITFQCRVVEEGTQTVSLTAAELTDKAGAGKTPAVTAATVTAAAKHVHSYGDWVTTDPDNHYKVCSCGEKSEVAAHTWEWKIDKEATATATGLKHEECACGAKRNENTVINKVHVHSYDTVKSDAKNHWKECSCGEKSEVTAHTYGEWTVIKEATADAAGSRERVCTVCGVKEVEEIPATGKPADPTPAPADPTPEPADPTPAPVDPTPAPADPTPEPADPAPSPETPKTGDTSSLLIWSMLLMTSFAGAAIVIGKKKNA